MTENSSGNASCQTEAEVKVVVAPKAITQNEEKTTTPSWLKDLPYVFRENRERPTGPVQVVVVGGRHLFALKSKMDGM